MIFNNSINLMKRRLSPVFFIFAFCFIIFIVLRIPITYVSFNEESYRYLFVKKRILFVTAHPDDEVMFFGPTVNSLRRIIGAENIHLLAITNGNYEGKGRIREKELWLGFEKLHLIPQNIHFYKREKPLLDHPHAHLPLKEVARGIQTYTQSLNIDLIVTFDGLGISGHINHGDIYKAINCCLSLRKPINVLALKTVNYLRKHSSIFDLPLSLFLDAYYNGDLVFVSGPEDVGKTKTSLYVHKSQYTTFHNILHHFSDRFLYINSLRQITIPACKPCSQNNNPTSLVTSDIGVGDKAGNCCM